jgi:hypothetical protein
MDSYVGSLFVAMKKYLRAGRDLGGGGINTGKVRWNRWSPLESVEQRSDYEYEGEEMSE